jgi:type II secretory pathway pseudopilin PulG
MTVNRMPNCKRETGFTLLVVLFLIAGFGVALAALGTLWQTHAQREKEAELLFIGDQYRQAIEHYYQLTPGTAKHYPSSFDALLRDTRFPTTVRHLRRLYRDPITGSEEWGLEKNTGGEITGVHSLSDKEPRKKAGFPPAYANFEGKLKYSDWVFNVISPAVAANGDKAR